MARSSSLHTATAPSSTEIEQTCPRLSMTAIWRESGISHRLASRMPRMSLVCYRISLLGAQLTLPGLQVALSPSYCSLVQIRNDGKVKWKQLDYHLGNIGSSMEDRKSSLQKNCFALLTTHSSLCSSRCHPLTLMHNSSNEKRQLR